MKEKEQKQAKVLRAQGLPITHIAERLGVSKSSVSSWVKSTQISNVARLNLSAGRYSREAVEKRRVTRLSREEIKRNTLREEAERLVKNVSSRDLFVIGVALYWAEGSKRKRGSVEFSNSDPRLIQVMKKFFTEICKVKKEKFRGHVYLHSHLSATRAEKYWSKVSGVPLGQFHKTSQQRNKASQNKKDNLPYGTFALSIYDTTLFLKIEGWTQGLYLSTVCI